MELTPEMKAAVGKSTDTTTYEVTSLGIRTFCRAVGYENPLYFDDEAAAKAGHRAIIAPTPSGGRSCSSPRSRGT